jgi:hypothetical protein
VPPPGSCANEREKRLYKVKKALA